MKHIFQRPSQAGLLQWTFVILALSCLCAQGSTTDDFSGTQVDSTKWSTSLPFPDSSVSVQNGYAALTQRGGLTTVAPFPGGLEISGRFRFAGASDHFRIVFRSDLTELGPFKERSGVLVNFEQSGGISIGKSEISGLVSIPFEFQDNQDVDFRITDDGATVRVYINNSPTPLLSVATAHRTGTKVAFYNREIEGTRLEIDSLAVTSSQNLLINGSLELPDEVLSDRQLGPGSTEIPGWTIGPEGGIDTIANLWEAQVGKHCVDLHSGDLGPGSIFQNVFLTNGIQYRLSFSLGFNPHWGLPVTLAASVGNITNIFTRSTASPFWQRRSFLFSPTSSGLFTVAFKELSGVPAGSPEVSLDNVVLEVAQPHLSIRVTHVEVCWESETNQNYQIQYKLPTGTSNWINLGSSTAGNGTTNCITDVVPSNESQRVYRVVKVSEP